MKVPYDEQARSRYNYHRAVQIIHNLIMDTQLRDYCCVSSFNFEALKEMEKLSHSEIYNVHTVYLTNFYNHIELPPID